MLVKTMEELGIDRPSTYAATIQTIGDHRYVTCFDKQGIGLGVAAVGGLIAESLPYAYLGKFSWLLPWGIVPAATPIDTVASYKSMRASGDMTLVSQPWSLAALAALVAVGWTVAAHLVIVHQENHR